MFYNLIVFRDKGIIRSADQGLNDIEFQLGARIRAQTNSQLVLERMFLGDTTENVELLDQHEWSKLFVEEEERELPHRRKVERQVVPETYNRGPYARKYRA